MVPFVESGRGVTTAADGGIYLNHFTSADSIERLRAWNDNGSNLRRNDPVGSASTLEALRGQIVASGDTLGIAFLLGAAPSPTVSTELHFMRTR